jgi:hypothetical protein
MAIRSEDLAALKLSQVRELLREKTLDLNDVEIAIEILGEEERKRGEPGKFGIARRALTGEISRLCTEHATINLVRDRKQKEEDLREKCEFDADQDESGGARQEREDAEAGL